MACAHPPSYAVKRVRVYVCLEEAHTPEWPLPHPGLTRSPPAAKGEAAERGDDVQTDASVPPPLTTTTPLLSPSPCADFAWVEHQIRETLQKQCPDVFFYAEADTKNEKRDGAPSSSSTTEKNTTKTEPIATTPSTAADPRPSIPVRCVAMPSPTLFSLPTRLDRQREAIKASLQQWEKEQEKENLRDTLHTFTCLVVGVAGGSTGTNENEKHTEEYGETKDVVWQEEGGHPGEDHHNDPPHPHSGELQPPTQFPHASEPQERSCASSSWFASSGVSTAALEAIGLRRGDVAYALYRLQMPVLLLSFPSWTQTGGRRLPHVATLSRMGSSSPPPASRVSAAQRWLVYTQDTSHGESTAAALTRFWALLSPPAPMCRCSPALPVPLRNRSKKEEDEEKINRAPFSKMAEGEGSRWGDRFPKGFLFAVEHPELLLPPTQWSTSTTAVLRVLQTSLVQQWTVCASSTPSVTRGWPCDDPGHPTTPSPTLLPTREAVGSPEVVFIGADGYPVDLPEEEEVVVERAIGAASPFLVSRDAHATLSPYGMSMNDTQQAAAGVGVGRHAGPSTAPPRPALFSSPPSPLKALQAKLVLPPFPPLSLSSSSLGTTTAHRLDTAIQDEPPRTTIAQDTALYHSFHPLLSAEVATYKRYEYFRLLRHLLVFRGAIVVLLGHVSSAAIPLRQWLWYAATAASPASSSTTLDPTTPRSSAVSKCTDAAPANATESAPHILPFLPCLSPLFSSCATTTEEEEEREGGNEIVVVQKRLNDDIAYRVATQLQASLQYHFELEHTYLDFPLPFKTLFLRSTETPEDTKEKEWEKKHSDQAVEAAPAPSLSSSPLHSCYPAQDWLSWLHHALGHEASRSAIQTDASTTPPPEAAEERSVKKTHPLYWISSSTYELPCTEKAIAEFSFFS